MIGSILAGVNGEYAINQTNKISIKAKALAGLALVKAPDLKAESKSDNAYATFTGKYGSAKGLSILLGAGLNYKLSNHFGLFLNSEYFKTGKISFKEATEIIKATDGGLIVPELYNFQNSYSHISYEEIGTREQFISTINLNAGITFSW